jgi:hypothetical protein
MQTKELVAMGDSVAETGTYCCCFFFVHIIIEGNKKIHNVK